MKRNNIFFGLIVVTIAVIVGMATLDNSKNTNNIQLLTQGDAPRVSRNAKNNDHVLFNGPEYRFATKEGMDMGKRKQPVYTPNFSVGNPTSGYSLLGNTKRENSRTGKRNGGMSISGGNISFGNRNNGRSSNSDLMALTAVGRSHFGATNMNIQLELEPFVETGSIARAQGDGDFGENAGDPVVPVGNPIIPLILFSSLWILYSVLKKK